MSGIVGLVSREGALSGWTLISGMTESLAACGPHGVDVRVNGWIAFGHALLRTGPHAGGISFYRDLVIVADARLDRRPELIQEFDAADRNDLAAATDPELILRSYDRWGERCVEHLTGDFCFALWDGAQRSLFCARDQFGVRPFFYAVTAEGLVFSNSLDCLRAYPGLGDQLNDLAVADFLLFGRNQAPATSVFARIQRLPGAHVLTWRPDRLDLHRYWSLPVPEPIRYRSPGEYVEHFRELLCRATTDRITSERTGIPMSGGVDSTLIAAAARQTGTDLKAFTVVCDDPIPDEERHYSQVAATALHLPVQYLQTDRYPLFGGPGGPTMGTPEPLDVPLIAVFKDNLRRTSEFSPVALTGQGGDPIMYPAPDRATQMLQAGQIFHLASAVWSYTALQRRFPRLGFRGALKRMLGIRDAPYEFYPAWLNPDFERALRLPARWTQYQERTPSAKHRERPLAFDALTNPLWQNVFERYNSGFTGVPIEVRHPLFDLRLVNYCLSLPSIPWFIDKTLARTAMQGWLPDSIRFRPKTPVQHDPVVARLPRSPWVDDWKSTPLLDRFLVRDSIPNLSRTKAVDGFPNVRPFSLYCWLNHLTGASGKDTKVGYEHRPELF